MKEQSQIPVSKVARATRLVTTGVKVGANYLEHHVEKFISGNTSRTKLHEKNAESIYQALSHLKGSALKVLQMISMDQAVLPKSYQERFSLSQQNVPPLSYPLVEATFQKSFKKTPDQIFDTFERKAAFAASIGQVHRASIGNKVYAVKVQYPGVAESVESDLKLVKPFAAKILNLNEVDVDYFFVELRDRLIEETDYLLELKRSQHISKPCANLDNLAFVNYHEEFSSAKILTMDWLDGVSLKTFIESDPPRDLKNRIGQTLWNFYDHQIHHLKQVHADPHPGNFIVTPDNKLGVLDFGCVKEIPDDFYEKYFSIIKRDILDNPELFMQALLGLNFLHSTDSKEEIDEFTDLFHESVELLSRPFRTKFFDFSDKGYFQQIYDFFGEKASECARLRESRQARGPRDGLFINRTYFGLYNLLHSLHAEVETVYPARFS